MDRALILAMGKALALFAVELQQSGVLNTQDLAGKLTLFASVVAENDTDQGFILAVWAGVVRDINPSPLAGEGGA